MATPLTGIVNPVLSDNATLSLDYGNTYKDGSFHKGIDLYSTQKRECDVIAPCDGTVTGTCNSVKGVNKSSGTAAMGNYVIIETASGIKVRFQHMKYQSVTVRKGAKVKKGQKLGVIGNTGNSTGRHLHFDVSLPNKVAGSYYSGGRYYVDPKPYLKGTKSFSSESVENKKTAPVASSKTGTVTASLLNVRSGAGLNHNRVRQIIEGTTVTILEEKDGWYRIGDGQWVMASYIKVK